jgi:transmembrane sensor
MLTNNSRDPNLEEAMDWLLRVREAPSDLALRRNLEAWVAADADHARAWDQARQAWRLMGDLPSATKRPDVRNASATRGRRVPWRRTIIGAAGAALAACLVLALVPDLSLKLRADHVTATAELRRVVLEDGSTVHMAPRSAIRSRYTAERRTVELLTGEAFFHVSPNPMKPFVVSAEGLSATVLGTSFAVRIGSDELSVSVRSGAVAVRYDHADPPVDLRLGPGNRITVARNGGAARQDNVMPNQIAQWRDGKLFVADTSIRDVVEELRRFQPGWVIIADERLATQRVTGLYDLNDPELALNALVRPFGGKVWKATPLLHVLSMP